MILRMTVAYETPLSALTTSISQHNAHNKKCHNYATTYDTMDDAMPMTT